MSDEDALKAAQQTMRRFQHEVRTPLGQIIGYSELLEEELEDRGQEELAPDLHKIRNAAQRLLDLVDGKLMVPHDRYQWPLLLGLICMLAEVGLRERRRKGGVS